MMTSQAVSFFPLLFASLLFSSLSLMAVEYYQTRRGDKDFIEITGSVEVELDGCPPLQCGSYQLFLEGE
jgi:hypothetical protein